MANRIKSTYVSCDGAIFKLNRAQLQRVADGEYFADAGRQLASIHTDRGWRKLPAHVYADGDAQDLSSSDRSVAVLDGDFVNPRIAAYLLGL